MYVVGVFCKERTENRGFRRIRARGGRVVEGVDKGRQTKDVGKEDELLPNVAADLTRRGEE